MPYGIKFVPLSPGMYNRAPQTDFPDLDKFVPIEVLIQAKKDVDEFLASPLFKNRAIGFPFDFATSHEVLPTSSPESGGYFAHDELEDHFDFLMQNDDNQSDTSTSSDGLSESSINFNGAANEDVSFGFLPEVVQDTGASDLTPDIAALISSIDVQQMDQETLDSFQKSLQELEIMFKDTAMMGSDT